MSDSAQTIEAMDFMTAADISVRSAADPHNARLCDVTVTVTEQRSDGSLHVRTSRWAAT